MTAELSTLLASLEQQRTAQQELADRLQQEGDSLFDPHSLPGVPTRIRPMPPPPPPPIPPTLSPKEVWEGWQAGGLNWLHALGRRDQGAVLAAFSHPSWGPFLAGKAEFVSAALALVSGRKQIRLLGTLYFCSFPPPPFVVRELERLNPGEHPRWISELGLTPRSYEDVASRVAKALLPDVVCELRRLELPGSALSQDWLCAMVKAIRCQSILDVERLVKLADGGKDIPAGAAVGNACKAAVRELVRFGSANGNARIALGGIARRRVGDVFGQLAAAAWLGLEAERVAVRSWLADRLLDIVFMHLVPNDQALAHQTAPRRAFWGRPEITASIERVWVAVSQSLLNRLEQPEIMELRMRFPGFIEWRSLQGGPTQAIVWLHLRGRSGVVTVVEGNANTSLRMRPGAHLPMGQNHSVDYNNHIVHGAFQVGIPGVFTQTHHGGIGNNAWQTQTDDALEALGIL